MQKFNLPTAFSVGSAKAIVNPPLGISLAGHGVENAKTRLSTENWDEIDLCCTALSDGENVALLFTLDCSCIAAHIAAPMLKLLEENFGIPEKNVILQATHTHAGPSVYAGEMNETGFYPTYVAAAVKAAGEALADLAETTISVGQKQIDRMVFVRHYVLDDGTFIGMGAGHPGRTRFHTDISDDQMQLIRFHREDARDILLVNWQCHATFTSGEVRADMSADFIAPLRNQLEGLSGCKVIYLQGAAGNLFSSSRIEEENILPRGDHVAYGRALA